MPLTSQFSGVCQAPEQRCGCVQCRHSHRCNGTWFVASLGPSGSSLVPACLHTLLLGCRQTLYPGLVSLSCAHFLQQAALGPSCWPKALLIGLNLGRRRHRQVATRTRTVDSMLQAATLSVSLVIQRDSLPCALRCCDFAGLLLVLESGVSVIAFAFPSSAT